MRAIEMLSFQAGEPMLFNSGLFLVVFLAFYGLYAWLKQGSQARKLWVVVFSSWFYYKASGDFLAVLLVSIGLDYWFALKIHAQKSKARRRAWLLLSLSMNLGILLYFKYTNFLLSLFAGPGFKALDIILPVGVSFFTFQSLSYTVEVYRKEIKPAPSLLDYAFFATFFPQLVAGPIVRAKAFLPQVKKPAILSDAALGRACFLIITGLFKKAVISDYISINFVDRVFAAPALYTGLENLTAAYGYALQIYCDFSGYSDMAIGIALLLGYDLAVNFDAPYQAQTLTEFWRRWHISLSSWLRDYLYIPLGGNRLGRIRTYVNLMLTMLLGGLWHGASLKFVAWGGLHGLGLSLERLFGIETDPQALPRFLRVFRRLLTFHLVLLSWVYFRSDDMASAGVMLGRIASGVEWRHLPELVTAYSGVFILMGLGYLLHFLPSSMDREMEMRLSEGSAAQKAVVLAAMIWLVIQVKSAQIQPFIYFQF